MLKRWIRRILAIESINSVNREQLLLIKELYWANVFNSTIHDSLWLEKKSFSPGRWAVNYSFLYLLYRILNDIKPTKIIEFGLGQSSKMTIQYAECYKECALEIIEHNIDWINDFKNSFPIKIDNYINILELKEIKYKNKTTLSYEGISEFIKNKQYDLIILDGPYGSNNYSRLQVIDFLKENSLKKSFVIIVDDYNRIGEKETVKVFTELLGEKQISYYLGEYGGEKDQCIICSSDNEFLVSL